jgi:hypothetical protein
VKIRYFGLLANRDRMDNIQLCRKLLDAHSRNSRMSLPVTRSPQINSSDRCPQCHKGMHAANGDAVAAAADSPSLRLPGASLGACV